MNDLIALIPPKFRRRGLFVACTLLLRAILNLVGLAVLLPVLALVLDPAWIENQSILTEIYHALGFESTRHFAIAISIGVVCVILLKGLINMYLIQIENHYVLNLYRALSRKLFTAYHLKGLSFIKRSNSAMLTRNVNFVCLQFVAGVLSPIAAITAEALLFILLFAALLWYAPWGALLSVALFVPTMWLYYVLVRHRMDHYGQDENKAQREKMRLVAETFRGYSDIEINGAFPHMLQQFDESMNRIIDIRLRNSLIQSLPSNLTEIVLALGMALLVGVSLGENATDARLLFGVFAVAALRLMPSVRSILSSWTAIRYNRYAIEILREAPIDTDPDTEEDASQKLPFEVSISVEHLDFRFEDATEDLFHDLSLTIHKGERVGIRGSSGAGKTTLFNLLLGLYTPSAGSIKIDGQPLTPQNKHQWQRRIGYVSQNLFLADASFAANVALGIPEEKIDRNRVTQALEAAQLNDFIQTLDKGMDTRIGECGCRLSGGQCQRIGIARALYRNADILFFDEATSALDAQTEEEVNRAIQRVAQAHEGLTIVVIAHRESTLEYCQRIITLE